MKRRKARTLWWENAIIARTLLLILLSGAVPLGLGLLHTNWPEGLPWRPQVQPWLPWAIGVFALGVPLVGVIITGLVYGSGRAGYDPGAGVATAVGVGAPPFVALAILLRQTGWWPLGGVLGAPSIQQAVELAVLAPMILLALFGAIALISPRARLHA